MARGWWPSYLALTGEARMRFGPVARYAGRVTYLITFSCYGTHLRGDPRGSVDRRQAMRGQPTIEPNEGRVARNRLRMTNPECRLDNDDRATVLWAIRETSAFRGWGLLAAHVRTEHVHVVVHAEASPESVVRDLKSYASRRLNRSGRWLDRRWTRGASTRWLKTRESVRAAVRYVVDEQGEPMAVYVSEDLRI